MKRLLAVTVAAVLSLAAIPFQHISQETAAAESVPAENTVTANEKGIKSSWVYQNIGMKLYDDNSIVISGTGTLSAGAFYSQQEGDVKSIITSATVTGAITEIGVYAFGGCDRLSYVTLSDCVEKIGEQAFMDTHLFSVTLPESVRTVDTLAFTRCKYLKSVKVLGENVSFGSRVFEKCTALNDVDLNRVTTLSPDLFYKCTALHEFEIPDSVRTIGAGAFSGSGLYSMVIPDSVYQIGERAFEGCGGLETLTIPDSVTLLGDHVWANCGLKSFTVPYAVKEITEDTFKGCYSLESVTLHNRITTIGANAFKMRKSLKSINLPSSVTTIGAYAFSGCTSLESVALPGSLTLLGGYAFEDCTALTSVVVPCLSPESAKQSTVFKGCTDLIVFEKRTVAKSYQNYGLPLVRMRARNGVVTLESSELFSDVSSVVIPDCVTRIQQGAFHDLENLNRVTIPATVTNIESQAFMNCPQLIILGYPGSAAEKYANGYSIPFLALERAVGDLNADGLVNAADAAALQDWLLCRQDTIPDSQTADLDGDGILTARDLTLLKQMI